MDFDKLYTVDDIALMTGLTSRTIRNYLKDGKLKGKKIGAQWRFTKEDIQALFKDKEVEDDVTFIKNKMVLDFLEEKKKTETRVCSVVDYKCKDSMKADEICQRIIESVNSYEGREKLKFSYQYIKEQEKARFIIIGEPKKVMELLENIQ